MKRVLLISFVFILAVYPKLNGQNIFPPVSAQLEKLFKGLIDNNNSQRKPEINDSIKT
jgi:pentose-5-phosphate-3-epimerase